MNKVRQKMCKIFVGNFKTEQLESIGLGEGSSFIESFKHDVIIINLPIWLELFVFLKFYVYVLLLLDTTQLPTGQQYIILSLSAFTVFAMIE